MRRDVIYHLCRLSDWQAAERTGLYEGSADDRRDGFIHFSTAAQVAASAARYRAGEPDLLLLTVPPDRRAAALRWDPAREGHAVPHLYAALPVAAVAAVEPLPLGDDGRHEFPTLGRRR